MRKTSVLRGGNFSEVSYGRVSGDKSAGRFFVFIQKNIDKCLRVLYFFVNLLPMRRILPNIGKLLFASVANCLCYFTSYGVHTFLCTQPLERMPTHFNEGFINRKWTMEEL